MLPSRRPRVFPFECSNSAAPCKKSHHPSAPPMTTTATPPRLTSFTPTATAPAQADSAHQINRQYPGSLGRMVTITFHVYEQHAPALRSAVEEISNEVGERLVGPHSFAKESALTAAAIALGALRSAVNAKVSKPDPDYA